MSRRLLMLVACLVLNAVSAFAQAAAPTDKFEWQQPASSLAQASAYRYDLEIDGAAPVVLAAVTCAGAATPFTCSASIPAVTPSSHTARVRAVDVNGTAIVGPWSDPLTFTMRATPAKPASLTIKPGD